jgi:hypothetical protein
MGLRVIRGWDIRRLSGKDSVTQRVAGRSSTKLPLDLMKIPTETGSTIIGPSDSK